MPFLPPSFSLFSGREVWVSLSLSLLGGSLRACKSFLLRAKIMRLSKVSSYPIHPPPTPDHAPAPSVAHSNATRCSKPFAWIASNLLSRFPRCAQDVRCKGGRGRDDEAGGEILPPVLRLRVPPPRRVSVSKLCLCKRFAACVWLSLSISLTLSLPHTLSLYLSVSLSYRFMCVVNGPGRGLMLNIFGVRV